MQKTHLDIQGVGSVLIKISELFHIKALIAIIGLAFSWIFEGQIEVLFTIYSLLFLDTLTGLWYAGKQKEISSRGFYRVVIKCFVYFIMIIVGRLVDKHVPLQCASPIMDSFLVSTEAFSILENLSKLGFPVPIKLVKLLKIYYDKK